MTEKDNTQNITISFVGITPRPLKLYYRGLLDQKRLSSCVAVVGSRRMTDYGRRVIVKMIPGLVGSGKIIVSGLMYGVDQTVHKECLACGGKTIAVLGWGLNWQGVGEDERKLAEEIINHEGAVISEWRDQRSTLWTFPQRDRIMAAMSSDIYVVEAAARSGALITAEWGRKLDKQIWAVPGPVTSKVSEGTNWLIDQGLAKMWLPEQQLGFELENRDREVNKNNILIYSLLQNEALTIDEIALKTGKKVNELGAQLTMMGLSGEVEERNGRFYLNR